MTRARAPPERAGRLSDVERANLGRLALRHIARPMLETLLQRHPIRRAEAATATT